MPDIKSTFTQGKMNKSLDERIIPKGQYKDAMNIQVSTSDDSDVGTVQNILGNTIINTINSGQGGGTIGGSWECVGSIADEKNNKLYWFGWNANKDAIFEYDTNPLTPELNLILVDVNKEILKFEQDQFITGINIVDNLLIWTDGVNEPRCINIDDCKSGTFSLNETTQFRINEQIVGNEVVTFWTQAFSNTTTGTTTLYLNNLGTQVDPNVKVGDQIIEIQTTGGSFFYPTIAAGSSSDRFVTAVDYTTGEVTITSSIYNGTGTAAVGNSVKFRSFEVLKEEHITLIKKKPTQAPVIETVVTGGPLTSGQSMDINFSTYGVGDTVTFSVVLENILIASAGQPYNNGNGGTSYDPVNPGTVNLDGAAGSANDTYDFFDGIPYNIVEDDIVVLSDPAIQGVLPNNAQIVLNVESTDVDLSDNSGAGTFEYVQNFTCTILSISSTLPTSAISYDFAVRDLEDLLFSKTFPRFSYRYKYKDGEYSAFGPFTEVVFEPGEFSIHPTREPYNSAMETRVKQIILKDYVTHDIPDGVVEIDLLYKPDNSTVVYAIETIKKYTTSSGDIENNWNTVDGTNTTINLISSSGVIPSNTGYYKIKTENIYAALPSNQLLRPFDNVPKKAKAQDFTAGRLIYGNYTQNLDLGDYYSPNMYLKYQERNFDGQTVNFDTGVKSIKSQRVYQAGIVYGDEYGRETPVNTHKNASVTIPYDDDNSSDFYGNASASNRLYFRSYSNNLKIKVNDNNTTINYEPYYFKVFIKETSSEYYNLVMDRVYRAEQDGNLWISFPSSDRNKIQEDDYIILKKAIDSDYQVNIENKFKVIDIKNEAPEFIRSKYTSLGQFDGNGTLTDLYPEQSNQPSADVIALTISKTQLQLESGSDLQKLFDNNKKLHISFAASPSANVSYISTRYKIVGLTTEAPDLYKITLNKKIKQEDSWVESSVTTKTLESTLKTNIFLEEQEQWEEFQGRFFVKILSNVVTNQYLESQIGIIQQYSIATSADIFNLADDSAASDVVGGVLQYTNSDGNQSLAGQTSGVSNHTTNSGAAGSISNTPDKWNNTTNGNLLFDGTSTTDSTGFFIDACYVAAMQPRIVSDMSNISYSAPGPANNGSPDLSANKYDVSVSGNLFRGGYSGFSGSGNSLDFGTTTSNWPNGFGGTADAMPGIFTPASASFEIRKQIGGGGPNARNDNNFTYESGSFYMHLSVSGVGPHLFPAGSSIRDGGNVTDGELNNMFDPQWQNGNAYGALNHKINLYNIQNNNQQPFIYMGATGDGTINDPGTDGSLGGYVYANRGMEVCNVPQDSDFDFNGIIDRTWDPTYNRPGLADFIQNLKTPGSKFTFGSDEEVYTILECEEVWIYNHTAWNRMAKWDGVNNATFNERQDTVNFAYHDMIEKIRTSSSTTDWADFVTNFDNKLTEFGAPDNRRVCYILKLDKNPTATGSSYNPTTELNNSTTGINMRFIQSYIDPDSIVSSDNPAVWETEPKENTDLDIYYEASNAIPIRLDINSASATTNIPPDNRKGHMIAPIGNTVRCSKSIAHGTTPNFGDCVVKSWDGNMLEIEPGLNPDPAYNNDASDQTIAYQASRIKFYKEDLSYVEVGIYQVEEISSGLITKLTLDRNILNVGLPYFNCYSFGNGVESNRIRDDFNQPFISNGVKASSTLKEQYKEDLRASGLIYSSIYNSTTSLNEINQFIMAETVTKDLLPTYGSIQKLFARNDDLIALCQDKIVQIPADKDIIFNADGNPQLTASNKVLGQARPFVGEYGISNNPESFASESYRAYFTDKQRGAVLRLSMDGLTPISDANMSTYFKDKLKEDAFKIVGSYDTYKKEYNLTIDDGSASKTINEFDSSSNSVTVSFKEDVRGWVSFKSFIPESGLSMGGNYYTFYNSHLYQHHLGNRSVFYNQNAICSLTAIINESPLSIKNFTTLNYDGDSGWQATIQTEKQSGTVSSFIEKEGKWFNYIKGEEDVIDTNAINFQGVGTCTTVNTL